MDPEALPAFPLHEAATAKADLGAANLAEEALPEELRNARETSQTSGESGRRTQLWPSESWRNIVIAVAGQALAWLCKVTQHARIGLPD